MKYAIFGLAMGVGLFGACLLFGRYGLGCFN